MPDAGGVPTRRPSLRLHAACMVFHVDDGRRRVPPGRVARGSFLIVIARESEADVVKQNRS